MTKPISDKPRNDKPQNEKQAHHDIVQVEVPAKPRKQPRQARSIAMVDAVKETGREILEHEGRDALTAQHLAERSGAAVSSIYEYFPTMEALIAAIFDDDRYAVHRELLLELQALPATSTLLDGILLMLRRFLAVRQKWILIDPEFTARYIRYDELQRLDVVKGDSRQATASQFLIERFSHEVTVRDRDKAMFFIYHTIQALPRVITLERPQYLDEPDTLVLLARMLHALLTTPKQ